MQASPARLPLWLAAFIAAVSMPFAWWAVVIVIEFAQSGSLFGELAMRSLGVLISFGVPLSLIAMFVFEYPLVLGLRRFGKLTVLNVCAGGVGIGALFALAVPRFFNAGGIDAALVLFAGGAGLFAGVVFCLVAGIPFRRATP